MKIFLIALAIALGVACSQPPAGRGEAQVAASPAGREVAPSPQSDPRFKIEKVAGGLEVPWSIVWAPDGRMIFTERPGRVRVIENGNLRAQPLFVVTDVEAAGESGLMGVALHPQFSSNRFIYLSYAYTKGGVRVRVVRYRETPEGLVDARAIIEDLPAARFHAGCRIRFGPDGKLYVTTGDAGRRDLAQQLDSLAGKTLRLNDDGTVPQDNPFVGQQNARPEIWSIGHRNAQGLDFQPGTNLMFQTEHGPSGFDGGQGGDEVNIVEKGKNYGWPVIHHNEARAGMEGPLLEYTPACAPASGAFYRGSALANFKGNYFFGCLRGERLQRVVLDGRRVVSQEAVVNNYGRIREVAEGPDGFLYFSTSNRDGRGDPSQDDDRILRIVPAQ